jgi:hypothetical protein
LSSRTDSSQSSAAFATVIDRFTGVWVPARMSTPACWAKASASFFFWNVLRVRRPSWL